VDQGRDRRTRSPIPARSSLGILAKGRAILGKVIIDYAHSRRTASKGY